MNETLRALTVISTAIIGLAVVSVILSQRANTASVISTAGQAFAGLLSTSTKPVTG